MTCKHPTQECQSVRHCEERGCPFRSLAPIVTDEPRAGVKLIVKVDIDEVCAAMLPAWLDRYNYNFANSLEEHLTPDMITGWDLREFVKPEAREAVYQLINTQAFYGMVKPVPGALEGVTRLRALGHRVLFVTTAMNGHAGAKLRWLQDHGFLPAGRNVDPDYIECSEKTLIAGEVIVDDNYQTCKKHITRSILFTQPHNDVQTAPDLRADSWADVVACVEKVAWDIDHAKHIALGNAPKPANETVVQTLDRIAASLETQKPSNPKDLIGANKVPLSLFPATAIALGSLAMLDGALKYGKDNFRAIGVRTSIYLDAALRHINAYLEGREADPDSKVCDLAHALACIAIVVDARAAGKLTDDRKVQGGYVQYLAELTPHVARLKALHADKAPKHYTIADNAALAQADGDE